MFEKSFLESSTLRREDFFLNDCQIFRSLAVLSSSAKLMSRAVSAILSLDLNSAKNIIYACFMEKLGNKS